MKKFGLLSFMILTCFCRQTPTPRPHHQPDAILLVTLDTTRADRVGYAHARADTPVLDGLAASGLVFEQAYTTAPMTLPAHSSMMTGLYASQHGVHENARTLGPEPALLSERLGEHGYRTAAFVSAYPLAREFGLARGFDHYDDSFPEDQSERNAGETNAVAIPFLESFKGDRLFLWVHYFDPHHPYAPPEPFKSQYPDDLYSGEIAYMDQELGRLIAAFKNRFAERSLKIIVAGDHGEGLGEHGETFHGYLLYQGVVHVPLILAGAHIEPGKVSEPVSIRQIYHTISAWLGYESSLGLEGGQHEIVMAEAMKPYLQYGWSPQVMAVEDGLKTIFSGGTDENAKTEVYDLGLDPTESVDLTPERAPSPKTRAALAAYALPDGSAKNAGPTDEQLEKLASLGYTMASDISRERGGRPIPHEMTELFADLDRGSAFFGKKRYADAIAVYNKVLEKDPRNFMIHLRLAVAYSVMGQREEALRAFLGAGALNEDSADLHHYLGMHYLRFNQADLAAPQFEKVLEKTPHRLPALEALARLREQDGRTDDAIRLYQKAAAQKHDPLLFLKLGQLSMSRGDSHAAVAAFSSARDLQKQAFRHHLELGVCLQDLKRFEEAAREPGSYAARPCRLPDGPIQKSGKSARFCKKRIRRNGSCALWSNPTPRPWISSSEIPYSARTFLDLTSAHSETLESLQGLACFRHSVPTERTRRPRHTLGLGRLFQVVLKGRNNPIRRK